LAKARAFFVPSSRPSVATLSAAKRSSPMVRGDRGQRPRKRLEPGARSRSRSRPNQNRTALDLCPRRTTLGWTGTAVKRGPIPV
jgi:hypothetical protein